MNQDHWPLSKPERDLYNRPPDEILADVVSGMPLHDVDFTAETLTVGPNPTVRLPWVETPRRVRLPDIRGFPDLNRQSDRVERRGDRVFLVDLDGRYLVPEVEVLPTEIDGLTEWQARMAADDIPLDALARTAREIADSPYLSAEGRQERLETLRGLVEKRFGFPMGGTA